MRTIQRRLKCPVSLNQRLLCGVNLLRGARAALGVSGGRAQGHRHRSAPQAREVGDGGVGVLRHAQGTGTRVPANPDSGAKIKKRSRLSLAMDQWRPDGPSGRASGGQGRALTGASAASISRATFMCWELATLKRSSVAIMRSAPSAVRVTSAERGGVTSGAKLGERYDIQASLNFVGCLGGRIIGPGNTIDGVGVSRAFISLDRTPHQVASHADAIASKAGLKISAVNRSAFSSLSGSV